MLLCFYEKTSIELADQPKTSPEPGVFDTEEKQGEEKKETAGSKQQKLSPHLDFSNVFFNCKRIS